VPPELPDIATTLKPCSTTGLAVPLLNVTWSAPSPGLVLVLPIRPPAWFNVLFSHVLGAKL
jgi:hypothetical protein